MAEVFDFGLQQHKIKMDGKFFENNLFAVAGDTGRRLEVQLLDSNNLVQNTTGISLRLNANVAGQATYAEAKLVDATKGLYELDLPNGMLIAPGTWQFQWQIIGKTGEKLHSFAFMGTIGSNLAEGGAEATNFYLNVDDLKQMQEDLINGTFDSEVLETNIAEKLNNLEEQYAPKLNEVTAQLAQISLNVLTMGVERNNDKVDSTEKINTIIQYAHVNGLDVYFPEGYYYLEGTLQLLGNVSLFGAGKKKTILKQKTDRTEVIRVINGDSNTIHDLGIIGTTSGSPDDRALIHVYGKSKNGRVFNCFLSDNPSGASVRLGYDNNGNYTENWLVYDNEIMNTYMGVELIRTKNPSVYNNNIHDIELHGVRLTGSKDANVFKNEITRCSRGISNQSFSNGIEIIDITENSNIENNDIQNCSTSGVEIYHESKGVTVFNNEFKNCVYGCNIYRAASSLGTLDWENITIDKNQFYGGNRGVVVRGFGRKISIIHNTIKNFANYGIHITDESGNIKDVEIKHNTLDSITSGIFGIGVFNTVSAAVHHNHIIMPSPGYFIGGNSTNIYTKLGTSETNTLEDSSTNTIKSGYLSKKKEFFATVTLTKATDSVLQTRYTFPESFSGIPVVIATTGNPSSLSVTTSSLNWVRVTPTTSYVDVSQLSTQTFGSSDKVTAYLHIYGE